jgi:DnaA family protein
MRLEEAASFGNFVVGDNGLLVQHLRAITATGHEPFTFLWGRPDTGKSHLLQATCQAAAAWGPVRYLPLREMAGCRDPLVEDSAVLWLACLDDIGALTGRPETELLLFELLNRLRDAGTVVVASHHGPPAALDIALADLASRLQWGPCFEVAPLDDDGKLEVMQARARARGFELSDEAARYLLARVNRRLGRLVALLDRLDEAALSEQRAVTVPFLREFLRTLDMGS